MQPRTSAEASTGSEQKAELAASGELTISPTVRAQPFGGPFFARLLALYLAGFLATTSLILGSWFLMLKPSDVPSAPPSAPASEVPR